MSDSKGEMFLEDGTSDRWFSYGLAKRGTKERDYACPFRIVVSEEKIGDFLNFIKSSPDALAALQSFVESYRRYAGK